jgi:hypothetical protein
MTTAQTDTAALAVKVDRQTAGLLTALNTAKPVLNTWRSLPDNALWQALTAVDECTPQYLRSVTGMPLNRISEQLGRLLEIGLLSIRKEWKYRIYSVNPTAVGALNRFCGHFTGDSMAYEAAYGFVWALAEPLRLDIYQNIELFGPLSLNWIKETFGLPVQKASACVKALDTFGIIENVGTSVLRPYYEPIDVSRKLDGVRRLAVQIDAKFQ